MPTFKVHTVESELLP